MRGAPTLHPAACTVRAVEQALELNAVCPCFPRQLTTPSTCFRYSPELGRGVTHLIVSSSALSKRSDKVRIAFEQPPDSSWALTIVTSEWLRACMMAGRVCDPTPFLVPRPPPKRPAQPSAPKDSDPPPSKTQTPGKAPKTEVAPCAPDSFSPHANEHPSPEQQPAAGSPGALEQPDGNDMEVEDPGTAEHPQMSPMPLPAALPFPVQGRQSAVCSHKATESAPCLQTQRASMKSGLVLRSPVKRTTAVKWWPGPAAWRGRPCCNTQSSLHASHGVALAACCSALRPGRGE